MGATKENRDNKAICAAIESEYANDPHRVCKDIEYRMRYELDDLRERVKSANQDRADLAKAKGLIDRRRYNMKRILITRNATGDLSYENADCKNSAIDVFAEIEKEENWRIRDVYISHSGDESLTVEYGRHSFTFNVTPFSEDETSLSDIASEITLRYRIVRKWVESFQSEKLIFTL